MDFRQGVIDALDKMVADKSIEAMIEKALEKCVQTIVDDQLRSYSDFGKQLGERVKESLKIGELNELPSYNHAILAIVRRQVDGYTNNVIQKQVAANLVELLEPAPVSITLSKLVEQYIEHLKKHRDAGCVCHDHDDHITVISRRDEQYGWTDVGLDDEPNKPLRECDIRFCVGPGGSLYSFHFQKQDVDKQLFAGPFYNFERSIFQMKAAGTKVVLDVPVDEIETYIGSSHD